MPCGTKRKGKKGGRKRLLEVCCLGAIALIAAVAWGAHTEETVNTPDVTLLFEPEVEAPAALLVDFFAFEVEGNETGFNLSVGHLGDQLYRGHLGGAYLLEPGKNSFQFRGVSNKGVVGGPSTLDLYYVPPTPTPIPDPVPPPFRARVLRDEPLE